MKFQKLQSALIASLVLICAMVFSPPSAQTQQGEDTTTTVTETSLFGNPVVAQNENFKIFKNELDDEYIIYKNEVEKRGRIKLNQNLKKVYEKNLLRRLAFSKILISKATEEEKRLAGIETSDAINNNNKDETTRMAFKTQVLALGLTETKFINKLRDRKIADKVLFRLMEPIIGVSDAEVKAYYDTNPSLFEVPPHYKVAHIMFSTRLPASNENIPFSQMVEKKALAEKAAAEAKKPGASFEELVAKYSEDPRSKGKGGIYEFVAGTLDPQFESVALKMVPGQISDAVQSRFGYHVIKFIEMKPARKEPLEGKLKVDIRERLKTQKLQENLQEFQNKLIAESNVEFLLDQEK